MSERTCSKCNETNIRSFHHEDFCEEHYQKAVRSFDTRCERLRILKEYVLPIVGTLAAITAAVFGILAYLGSLA